MNEPFNLSAYNLPFLIERIKALDPTRQWQVIIREKQTQRSIDQNSRLWDLYTALGNYIGEDKDAVHELMGWKFLRSTKTVNGMQIETIMSTTKLSTKAMAEYQENIERWAAEIGFLWEDK